MAEHENIIDAAVQASMLGFTPVPLRRETKKPALASWGHLKWESPEQVEQEFRKFVNQGLTNVGLCLGEANGSLVDIDIDHPSALKLRDHFLPRTAMQTGRVGFPRSHLWYIADGEVPEYRPYRLPNGEMLVEVRSSRGPAAKHQTVIPPSVWINAEEMKKVPGTKLRREKYRWEGAPFGGEEGPAHVDGRVLAAQGALLALGATLLDAWPESGSRHEAYLALAGGLLRYGDGTHPFWSKNLPVLIAALADATNDDDGAETRVAEVMGSTITRLSEGGRAIGFGRLAEILGPDHAEMAKRRARDVEALAGFVGQPVNRIDPVTGEIYGEGGLVTDDDDEVISTLPPVDRNPMEERISSWAAVDLGPYLAGEITLPTANVLSRTDGKGLFYPGRVNSLYGMSESGKSWVSLGACVQEIAKGERVIYIDFEDEPAGTLARIQALGVGDFDIHNQFRYVHPEGPLADMQKSKFGARPSEDGLKSHSVFAALLESYDPTLIVCDGMTVIYGLHALDSNDAMSTDVITSWHKSLARGGRTTVIVIDHTGKTGGAGSSPIGAHHKVAMVQGSALRADPVTRPMPGAVGKINLVVYKDRPGSVRAVSSNPGAREQVAAVVTLDSTTEGVTRMIIDPPDPKASQEAHIGTTAGTEAKLDKLYRMGKRVDEVLELFEEHETLRTADLVNHLQITDSEARDIWDLMRSQMLVERLGNNTRLYHYRKLDK